MIIENFQKTLIDTAFSMGATDAKIFNISDIVFDKRPLLKCLFGCSGGYHYCPTTKDVSNAFSYSEIIKEYHWGIITCTNDLKTGQDLTLKLESDAFLEGYYFAFGATECVNCANCTAEKNLPCVDKSKMRPPLYSLGIDVYKTVRGLGWELNVVQEKGDPVKNITAVFVE